MTTTLASGHADAPAPRGAVLDTPRLILRAEGAALFTAGTAGYAHFGGSWWLFAALFLAPDLFMLGYLVSKKLGAAVYNVGHSTLLPLALAAVGMVSGTPLALSIGLIWLAHVGFDRMVGYGLKYPEAFKSTHLGTPGL